MDNQNKYTQMQLNTYNYEASLWTEENRNLVVGPYDAHNEWLEYENLFLTLENQSELIGLDFACGPGRNIVKYKSRFKRLDGVDISPVNIEKATQQINKHNIDSILYVSNGIDINIVPSDTYDFVMSTIALQHICVYDIRFSILKDIYRVLKRGGIITAQMGFGYPDPKDKQTVHYLDNFYDASHTNGLCDVRVTEPRQIQEDLTKIGFTDIRFVIGNTGPGDAHPNWIYFRGTKN